MLLLKCVKTPPALDVSALGMLPHHWENVRVVQKECPEQGWRETSPKGQGALAELLRSDRELFEMCWGESGPQHLRLCLQNLPGSECATVCGAKTQRLSFIIPCTDCGLSQLESQSHPLE